MKKIIISSLFLLISSFIFAQDYMDKITENTCECTIKIPEDVSNQEYTARLGVCMLEAAVPYEEKLLKDYGIDMKKIDTQGEELGRIIGMKMAGKCPSVIAKMSSMLNENGEVELESDFINLEGEVTAINKSKFVEFTIKDEQGKASKYNWLGVIKSDLDIENEYETLIDKKVKITFKKQKYFDPRINEYKLFKIINSINLN